MKKALIDRLHRSFEDCVHSDNDAEFWLARELQQLLGYTEWRNFAQVIDKARAACTNAGQDVGDHFVDVNKMIEAGKGANRNINDLALSRYACYLIAQNGNPQKDEIAFAMTYFAVQTRKQELIEQRLAERERRQARDNQKALIAHPRRNFDGCAHEQDAVEYWNARDQRRWLGCRASRRFEAVID